MSGRYRARVMWVLIAAVALVASIVYLRWYSRAVITADSQPGQESVYSTLDEKTSRRLLQVLTEARNRLGVPSLQAAVVNADGVWTGSVGWADPRARRAATVADVYLIGSVTKLYTATIILKLAEEGKLSLDDRVGKFVADMPGGEQMTVRQLLNHTSGLANYSESASFLFKTMVLRKEWTPDEILTVIRESQPYFAPGTRHHYSNSNYVLLGIIAERAGGQPFAALLAEKILKPLGLRNTFFAPGQATPVGLATGYDASLLGFGRSGIKTGMQGVRVPFETAAFTAGGITASALDVAAFTYGLFAGRILQPETLHDMLAFVAAPDSDVPAQTGYGLGVRRLQIGGDPFVGHTGVFPGYSNLSLYAAQEGYAVTVLSNQSSLLNLSAIQISSIVADIQDVVAERR